MRAPRKDSTQAPGTDVRQGIRDKSLSTLLTFTGGGLRSLKGLGLDDKSGDRTTDGADGRSFGGSFFALRSSLFFFSFLSVLVLGSLEGNIPVCRALIFGAFSSLLANAFWSLRIFHTHPNQRSPISRLLDVPTGF